MSAATDTFSGMKRTLLVAIATAFLLTGCASTASEASSQSFDATGTVTVPSGAHKQYEGDACDGFRGISDADIEGFDDIATGAQVVVKDASGTVIATSELQGGVLVRGASWSENSIRGMACSYSFTLTDLPDGSFYGIHVGDSTRSDVQFSKAEMQAGPTLSFG